MEKLVIQMPATWRRMFFVLWTHTRLASRITCALATIILLIAWLWLCYQGHPWDWQKLWQFHQHFLIAILVLHLLPVNIYCIRRMFLKPINDFQIILIKRNAS